MPRAVALHLPLSPADSVLPPARRADPLVGCVSGSRAPPAAESIQHDVSSFGIEFIWREMDGLPWDSQERKKKMSFHKKGF